RWSDASLASLVDGNASARLGRQALAGASLFALLTLAVCRAAHHLAGVPFQAEALAASIQHKGLIQNLVVEPETKEDGTPTGYYLVTAGEGRRLA
ncbi:ParB N-terminal domain-containing protein, partial [Serratia marcescens]|uniref:ParB N-terminal domain-containing protein n=1 Tax=Serratia marcescens TaxID=615 RepID=UPI0019536A46